MDISPVIAIDGPSGSGKSTIAKLVAAKLGYLYIDTGAMFRALAIHFSQKNILVDDLESLKSSLSQLDFRYGESSDRLIVIDGENLTDKIREHHVSDLASIYSKVSVIREYLLNKQRDIGNNNFCVMEGRDIGTVVFPNAYIKIFLTASPEVRAKRRYNELISRGEQNHSVEKILEDIKIRDERDKGREEAPLVQASDAQMILTDDKTIEELVNQISTLSEKDSHKVSLKK